MNFMCSCNLAAILCIIALTVSTTDAGKILLKPAGPGEHNSHRIIMELIASLLAGDGHEAVLLLGDEFPNTKPVTYRTLTWTSQKSDQWSSNEEMREEHLEQYLEQYCELLLTNRKLLRLLTSENFDLVVLDELSLCDFLLIKLLQKQFVIIGTIGLTLVQSESPPMLSYIPSGSLTSFGSDHLTFTERLQNVLHYYMESMMMYFLVERGTNKLGQNLGILQGGESVSSIRREASMIFPMTNYPFEYPQPLVPNVKPIGGLTARPVENLQGITRFISAAKNKPLVLVTFGTLFGRMKHMEEDDLDNLLKAFERLSSYHFVWSLDKTNWKRKLPDNVQIFSQLPQNDLLGLNQTVLFISHCGINSIFEAIYHAVPILALPLHGDQFRNAAKVHGRGLGISLDYRKGFTDDHIVFAVESIVENFRYKDNMQRLSEIFKAAPMKPEDVLKNWINYTLNTNGAHHLRSGSIDLHIFQYWLLDVFLAFLALSVGSFAIALYVAAKISRWLDKDKVKSGASSKQNPKLKRKVKTK